MTLVSDLKKRGNVAGFYKRPAGSDGYPPTTGTRVDWVLAQPVQDLLEQGKRLKWTNKGTIGNPDHLKKHGDHTGHSLGKVRGVVYAKDTALPKGGKDALLYLCKLPDYDTRWIDFFNVDGGQYNYAGKRVAASSDQHLHVSVKRGAETLRVSLFDDIAAVLAGTFGKRQTPAAFQRLGFVDGALLVRREGEATVWLAGRGKRTKLADGKELELVRQYLQARGAQDGIVPVGVLSGDVV